MEKQAPSPEVTELRKALKAEKERVRDRDRKLKMAARAVKLYISKGDEAAKKWIEEWIGTDL